MQTFGPYELLERLATGGMGEIFLARLVREAGFEKIMVIKRILPHLSSDTEFIEMFNHEARIAAKLNHQNIVQIFDFGNIDGTYFIAMEYVHGADVKSILEPQAQAGTGLAPGLVLTIASECLRGLHAAHTFSESPIIHRDVSPQNILLSFAGEVKLTDFGLAKALKADSLSEGGAIKGKFAYMSPEQVSHGVVDARSDLFSLGAVMYECLSGAKLFDMDLPLQKLLSHIAQATHMPLKERVPQLTPDLAEAVERALEINPANRYGSALEMKQHLDDLASRFKVKASSLNLSMFVSDLIGNRPIVTEATVANTVVAKNPIAAPVVDHTPSLQPPLRDVAVNGQGKSGPTASRRTQKHVVLWLGMLAIIVIIGATTYLIINSPQDKHHQKVMSPTRIKTASSLPAVNPSPKEIPLSGRLEVATNPAGAALFVDGVDSGKLTPTGFIELPPGEHAIHLKRTGYAPITFSYTIKAGATVSVTKDLSALAPPQQRTRIVTDPAGAEVLVDNQRLATLTPLAIESLSPGAHTIIMRKEGFKEISRSIVADSQLPVELTFTLEPQTIRLHIPGRLNRSIQVGQTLTKTLVIKPFIIKVRITVGTTAAKLTLSAQPFAVVRLNGRKLGPTPLSAITLTYDRAHSIALDNKKIGKTRFVLTLKKEEA